MSQGPDRAQARPPAQEDGAAKSAGPAEGLVRLIALERQVCRCESRQELAFTQ